MWTQRSKQEKTSPNIFNISIEYADAVELRHLTDSKTHSHTKLQFVCKLLHAMCSLFTTLSIFEFCNYTIVDDVFVCFLCGLRFHFVSFGFVSFFLVVFGFLFAAFASNLQNMRF